MLEINVDTGTYSQVLKLVDLATRFLGKLVGYGEPIGNGLSDAY